MRGRMAWRPTARHSAGSGFAPPTFGVIQGAVAIRRAEAPHRLLTKNAATVEIKDQRGMPQTPALTTPGTVDPADTRS